MPLILPMCMGVESPTGAWKTNRDHSPAFPKLFSPYQLSMVAQFGMGACEPFHYRCPGFDLLDLIEVLSRQPQLLWIHECSSHALSWRGRFTASLPSTSSVLTGGCLHHHPSRLRDLFGRGDRKILRVGGGGRYCVPDTTGLIHTCTHRDCDRAHKACTSSSHRKSQHGEKGVGTKSHPSQEVVCNYL